MLAKKEFVPDARRIIENIKLSSPTNAPRKPDWALFLSATLHDIRQAVLQGLRDDGQSPQSALKLVSRLYEHYNNCGRDSLAAFSVVKNVGMLDVNTANPVDVESLRTSINGFAKEMRSQGVRDDHLRATQQAGQQLPDKNSKKGEKKHCPPCDMHTAALKAACLHHGCKTFLESRTGRQRLTEQAAKKAINEASLLFAHSMGIASAMRYAATERISTFDIVLPTDNPEVFVPLAAALFVPGGAAKLLAYLERGGPVVFRVPTAKDPSKVSAPSNKPKMYTHTVLVRVLMPKGTRAVCPVACSLMLFHVAMVCARDCPKCKVNLFGFVVRPQYGEDRSRAKLSNITRRYTIGYDSEQADMFPQLQALIDTYFNYSYGTRYTFAKEAAAAGVDRRVVAYIMGHDNVGSQEAYIENSLQGPRVGGEKASIPLLSADGPPFPVGFAIKVRLLPETQNDMGVWLTKFRELKADVEGGRTDAARYLVDQLNLKSGFFVPGIHVRGVVGSQWDLPGVTNAFELDQVRRFEEAVFGAAEEAGASGITALDVALCRGVGRFSDEVKELCVMDVMDKDREEWTPEQAIQIARAKGVVLKPAGEYIPDPKVAVKKDENFFKIYAMGVKAGAKRQKRLWAQQLGRGGGGGGAAVVSEKPAPTSYPVSPPLDLPVFRAPEPLLPTPDPAADDCAYVPVQYALPMFPLPDDHTDVPVPYALPLFPLPTTTKGR